MYTEKVHELHSQCACEDKVKKLNNQHAYHKELLCYISQCFCRLSIKAAIIVKKVFLHNFY